jgi:hypothetical protein
MKPSAVTITYLLYQILVLGAIWGATFYLIAFQAWSPWTVLVSLWLTGCTYAPSDWRELVAPEVTVSTKKVNGEIV